MAPEPEAITDVMNSCNCSHDRAIKLLILANNDPEKAKRHHQTLLGYMSRRKVSSSQSSELTTPRSSSDTPPQAVETSSVAHGHMNRRTDSVLPLMDRMTLDNPPAERSGVERLLINEQSLNAPPTYDESLQSSDFTNPRTLLSQGRVPLPLGEPTEIEDVEEIQNIPRRDGLQELEWDFILPVIPHPPTFTPGNNFDISEVVGAMQYGAPLEMIQNYLGYYDLRTTQRGIDNEVAGFPSIFFAVATNNEAIIRMWAAYGGDLNSVHATSGVPLLAFAIMNSEYTQENTTRTLATLLSLGATPDVIPAAFYTPFCRDLPPDGPEIQELGDVTDENKKWCTVSARAKLARTANLTQRYFLERAAKTKKPSVRHRQIAQRRNAEALLGIPYFLIGQTFAANLLLQKLLSHILIPSQRPLVLTFAGPSGHGKTELARSLGHLLSLELEVVDCTIFSREQELFGPRAPWAEWEKGSPLNNFLARKAGERCIVFLDEFEKTSRDIHQTLLLPFDSGDYEDRRNRTKIDCSKTIWILATNALDPTIKDFCSQNHDAIFIDDDQDKMSVLMKQLSRQLKVEFLRIFDSPLTGRVSSFLPFLPFSPGEQAVVVHKYLLELTQKVYTSINLSSGPNEQLLGNVKLRIRKDASVCQVLANAEYHADLGARSLITAVKGMVEDVLVERYLEVDREIKEGEKVEVLVDVNGGEVVISIVDR